jgi:ribonuclease HII
VHHRSFFAPVVAAREKHQPWTIERNTDLFEQAETAPLISAAE